MQSQTKTKIIMKNVWKCFMVLFMSFFVNAVTFQTPVYAANTNVQVKQEADTLPAEQDTLSTEQGAEGSSFLMVFMVAIIFLVIVVVIVVASATSTIGAVMSKQLDE